MEMRSKDIHISRTLIETGLWHIERYLLQKYGSYQAAQDMAPLNMFDDIIKEVAAVKF